MITKVFCYSKNVAAKRCGIKSIRTYIILFISFMILMLLSLFLLAFDVSTSIVFLIFFLLFAIGIYYEIKLVLEMNDKMSAMAIDNNGALYKVTVIDRGAEFGLLGISTGNLLSQLTDNVLFKEVGSKVGIFFMFKQMNKAISVMSVPNNIAMIISNAKEYTGVVTQKITRIYKLENKKKKIIIYCDFELYEKDKIKHNKKIIIKKKYNNIEEIEKMLGVDI